MHNREERIIKAKMIPFFAQAFDSKQAGEYAQVFNAYKKKANE